MKAFIRPLVLLILCIGVGGNLQAKTRRSAARIIPTADFIGGGELNVGYNFLVGQDTLEEYQYTHMVPLEFGASEWLNVSAGWTGEGISIGLKGRILDEYSTDVVSLAFGARNLYYSWDRARARLSGNEPELTTELYLVASKSYEPITVRFHGGLLSMPNSNTEQINGFFGIEKYLGKDFYITLEGWSLRERFNLALFSTFRFLPKRKGELVFGFIDLENLLFDERNDVELSLVENSSEDWVKPAFTVQFNYQFSLGIGHKPAFRTLENLYNENRDDVSALKGDVDALHLELAKHRGDADSLASIIDSLKDIVDAIDTMPPLYETLYGLLIEYGSAYKAEPLDVMKIKQLREEMLAFGDEGESVLIFITTHEDTPREHKLLSVAMLGMFKSENAVPTLLEELAETRDSRYKVEIITSLGSIGDKTVAYAIQHLAESQDMAVALAAREVLKMWDADISSNDEKKITPLPSSANDFIVEEDEPLEEAIEIE